MGESREGLYTALINIRNTEVQVYWTRYNIQSALNAVVLAGGLAALKGPNPLPDIVLLPLSLGGFVMSCVWLWFAVLGKRLFVEGWEEWIAEYEERWLRPHYGTVGTEQASFQRPFLLFHGLKTRGARSPIHPDPTRDRAQQGGPLPVYPPIVYR
ncbi:MAG: hypothetical protein HYV04_12370, partial [Deltaproteobacteria bacterium]|nr:hypothetical protein [Deltaproteobacteria bacterium]